MAFHDTVFGLPIDAVSGVVIDTNGGVLSVTWNVSLRVWDILPLTSLTRSLILANGVIPSGASKKLSLAPADRDWTNEKVLPPFLE